MDVFVVQGAGIELKSMINTHYYAWKNNEKRQSMYKRPCRILATGNINSCMIEFENGQREIVSRRAIRRKREKEKAKNTMELGLSI